MKEFIDVCAEMRVHAKSLDFLHQRIAQEEAVVSVPNIFAARSNASQVDPEAIYESGVQTLMDEYAGKTSRQKYLKDPRYSEFQSSIWVSLSPRVEIKDLIQRYIGGAPSGRPNASSYRIHTQRYG